MPSQTDEYQEVAEKEFAEWEKEFEEKLKENYHVELPIMHPCFSIGEKTAKSIMTWCAKNGDSASDLSAKLHYLSRFITELYDALVPQDAPAASNRRYGFWSHVDLNNIC